MPTTKVLPKITFRMGAAHWGLTIVENGTSSHIDFASLDRPDRRKARRMTVAALEAAGRFVKARTASERRV